MEAIFQNILYDAGKYMARKFIEKYNVTFESGVFAFEFVLIVQFRPGEGPTPNEAIMTIEQTLKQYNFNNREGIITYDNLPISIAYDMYSLPLAEFEDDEFEEEELGLTPIPDEPEEETPEDIILNSPIIKDIDVFARPHLTNDPTHIKNGLIGSYLVLKDILQTFKRLEETKDKINLTGSSLDLKIYFTDEKSLHSLLDKINREIPSEFKVRYTPIQTNIYNTSWIRINNVNELFLKTLIDTLLSNKSTLQKLKEAIPWGKR